MIQSSVPSIESRNNAEADKLAAYLVWVGEKNRHYNYVTSKTNDSMLVLILTDGKSPCAYVLIGRDKNATVPMMFTGIQARFIVQ